MSTVPEPSLSLDGLWTFRAPLAVGPLQMGAAMTVLRRADGGLLLHSPIAHSEALQEAVESLGPIWGLLAPNSYHHLSLKGWMDACPGTEVFVAPGLLKKRPDLEGAHIAEGDGLALLRDDALDALLVQGMPQLSEVVLLHRPSRSVVLTDLIQNLQEVGGLTAFYRWLFALSPGQSPIMKLLLKDKAAYVASMQGILAWEFDTIVLAHNTPILREGRAQLEQLALSRFL